MIPGKATERSRATLGRAVSVEYKKWKPDGSGMKKKVRNKNGLFKSLGKKKRR